MADRMADRMADASGTMKIAGKPGLDGSPALLDVRSR
jgi:hypothetical protein